MQQQNNPMMFVRSLKGSPASVLWTLVLVRQALTARQLCAYTGYKLDSVREAMQVLAGYNIVVEQRLAHGESLWALADGVQFLLPGIDPRALSLAGVGYPVPEEDGDADGQNQIKSNSDEAIVIDAKEQNRIKSDSKKGADFQSWKKSNSDSKNGEKTGQNQIKSDSEMGSINQELIDDDEFNILSNSSSSIMNPNISEIEAEENVVTVFDQPQSFPTLKVVLANMELLFGDYLTPDMFASDLSPELALAWICKAYFDVKRNPKFKNPVGMIRLRLSAKAPRKVLHLQDMPDHFLDAIGLWEGRCAYCGDGFRSLSALSAHNAQGHPDDDAENPATLDESDLRPDPKLPVVGDFSVLPAWESVLQHLQADMPRASFDTWVKDTRPVTWDQAANRVAIGARDAFARDWLENRLRETCAKLVSELVGRSVELEFVCGGA